MSTWRPLDAAAAALSAEPDRIGPTSGTNSIGVGAYDALQASVRQRSTDGLEFLASYTYSKALSDNVGYYGVGWGADRDPGLLLPRQHAIRCGTTAGPLTTCGTVFSFAANYELPFGKGRKNGSRLERREECGPRRLERQHASSRRTRGLPITVYDGAGQSLQATRSFERPEPPVRGRARMPAVRTMPGSTSAASSTRPAGQFGDSGVGILTGPGYWNVDFGLSKNFYFDDSRYLTFRIEAFNVFNHPNFGAGLGSADISNPTTFGRIRNTFSAPRIVELVAEVHRI